MKKETKKEWYKQGIIFFAKTTSWIGIPVVLAVIVGKSLDEKLGSTPYAIITSTILAFIISCIGILKEVQKYIIKNE